MKNLQDLKDNKEKQIKAIEDKSDAKLLIQEKNFNKLLDERMYEMQKMSGDIEFNQLTYYFKNQNLAPLNFIGFRGLLNIYEKIKNGNISIKKAKEYQKKFKSNLNKTTSGNPKYREIYQSNTLKILEIFIIQGKMLSIYLMIMLKLDLKLCIKQNMEQVNADIKMDTIFMNSENSKTSEPHVLIFNLTDKLDLGRGEKSVALSHLSIYCTWKNIKPDTIIINLKYQLQNGMINLNYLMDHILYQIFRIILSILKKKQNENDANPSIRRIYVSKIENRIAFKN